MTLMTAAETAIADQIGGVGMLISALGVMGGTVAFLFKLFRDVLDARIKDLQAECLAKEQEIERQRKLLSECQVSLSSANAELHRRERHAPRPSYQPPKPSEHQP